MSGAAKKQDAVVVVLIDREGRTLLGRRAPIKSSAPGYWSPISGKIEPGEDEATAVTREAAEETGLQAEALRKITDLTRTTDSIDCTGGSPAQIKMKCLEMMNIRN